MSPSEKYYGVGYNTSITNPRASSDGDSIYFPSNQALPNDRDGLLHLDSRAQRGQSGWATTPLLPATASQSASGFADAFFQRLGVGENGNVLYATRRSLDPADQDVFVPGYNMNDLYLRRPDGSFEWVTHGTINTNSASFSADINWGVLSSDGTHVLFESAVPLLPADAGRTGGKGLYDWHNGQLDLVGVDDSGTLLSPDGVGLGRPSASTRPFNMGLNAVSDDGRRIFFMVDGRTFVRIDDQRTKSLAPGTTQSTFQGATPDGSQAFFVTDAALTPDDTDTGPDLYRYTVSDGAVALLSKGDDPADALGLDPQPIAPLGGVRVSDDGRRVYFLANGQLTADAPPVLSSDLADLYLSDDGQVKYVGQVAVSGPQGAPYLSVPPDCDSNWRATPDGEHVIFDTPTALTPDDTDATADVYEFSAESGDLVRVSGEGSRGNGPFDARMGDITWGVVAQVSQGGTCDQNQTSYTESRVMSHDGRFVFFDTNEGLVPRDTNGVMDVYEHDLKTGQTSLVSGGTGAADSVYLDNGSSGRDVFFATFDPLVPQDVDTMFDVYDARIDGGFPAVAPSAACREDDCQGSAHVGVPSEGEPSSATVRGSSSPARPLAVVHIRPALMLARPSSASLLRAARTGQLRLVVRASTAGQVDVRVRVAVGRRLVTVGRRSVKLGARKAATVTVALSKRVRGRLRSHGHVSLSVRAALTPGDVVKTDRIRLSETQAAPRDAARAVSVQPAQTR